MGFKEWNLDMALYYGGFNFITMFHFQYYALDPIIFGYNNVSVIFLCVSNQHCSLFDSIFIPFIFYRLIEYILICRSPHSLFFKMFKFVLCV